MSPVGLSFVGWVCAESNGWKMFCESVVKVTKVICKMMDANPETGGFDARFCRIAISIMQGVLVFIEKTYEKVLYFSIDNREKRC